MLSVFWNLESVFSLLRFLWPIAAASLLAVAAAAVQLLPTAELSGLSIRSQGLTYREVVSFSLRPTNLHYSLLPPLGLDLTQPLGQAFSEWVAYLGISGLLLALLGATLAWWQPKARPFVLLSGVGLLLSLGMFTFPLYWGLYKFVPGFSLFRVPARWLLLYGFGAAALAGFGFDALRAPQLSRSRLEMAWRWLMARRWHWLLPLLPALGLLVLLLWKTPPLLTLLAWALLAGASLGLMALALRPMPAGWAMPLLAALLLVELFWAAQSLNVNQPTAPQAFSSWRNSIAFLRAADTGTPPGRFLSLSGITYDPGDLADLQQIFGDHLSEQALYNLIVATKQKEVLFFNLPLLYGLHSVDGYDGGILPLTRFLSFQKLFLPADDLSTDGRLREKLKFVPANKLLSLANTRWVITDKQFDAWIDGIFYDLQFPARLAEGQGIATDEIPDFAATAIGLVSHLEGGAALPDGAAVAEITITFADGQTEEFTLQAGLDTAEGLHDAAAGHAAATVGVQWPYEQGGVDYIAVKPLGSIAPIRRIEARALLPVGQFVLRGVSLINQPTTTSRSVLLSTEGDYRQVHSGDVKVYENRGTLPRAFVVHQLQVVADEAAAVAEMTGAAFDPRAAAVREASPGEATGEVRRGQPNPADRAEITGYGPERVEIAARLESPGWLVLADTYYPGWQATVNGQPVEIAPVNLLFRAVELPAGDSAVVFEFRPNSVRTGALASGIALFTILMALAALWWVSR